MEPSIAVVPRTVDAPGKRFVYIEHGDPARFMELFSDLATFVEAHVQPLPAGGMLTTNTAIRLPSGNSFVAVSVRGELDQWERAIQAFADSKGLRTAKVRGHALVSSDGHVQPLEACAVLSVDL